MNVFFYYTLKLSIARKLNPNQKSGFTLFELLVAVLISSGIVAATGIGLITILENNVQAQEQEQRRAELNRALDYISEDIRRANQIQEVPTAATLPSGATGLFQLNIPDSSDDIVYFVRESTSTWLPDYTIYRVEDDFSSGISISSISSTGVNELVDAIAIPNTAPTSASCTVSSPTFTGGNGAYVCIGDSNRIVELFLYGNLPETKDNPDTIEDESIYLVNSKAFARGN